MAQKITYYLTITLVLAIGFGQLLRYDLLGHTIYLHDLLVVIIIALRIRTLRVPKLALGPQLVIAGFVIGITRALTLYPVDSLLLPLFYPLRLVAYFALYLVLARQKLRLPHRFFLISGLVSLVIGLLQYLLLPDMRIFQVLGWDDHLNRLTLPHFDPTYSGIFLVLLGLLANKYNHRLLAASTIPVIMLTYARSVWLSLLLTLATKLNLKLVIAGFFALATLASFLPKNPGEGNNLLRLYSISSRLSYDYELVKQVSWNIVTGVGYNTLGLLQTQSSLYQNHANTANNSYLTILLTTGIVGLIGTMIWLRSLLKSYPEPFILRFILFASLFNNVLFYPFIILWLILLVFISPTSTSESG